MGFFQLRPLVKELKPGGRADLDTESALPTPLLKKNKPRDPVVPPAVACPITTARTFHRSCDYQLVFWQCIRSFVQPRLWPV